MRLEKERHSAGATQYAFLSVFFSSIKQIQNRLPRLSNNVHEFHNNKIIIKHAKNIQQCLVVCPSETSSADSCEPTTATNGRERLHNV